MPSVATTFDGAVILADASGGVPSTAVYQGGIALRQDGAMYVSSVLKANVGRRVVILGDSIMLGCVQSQTVTSVTVSAGELLVTLVGSHAFGVGNKAVFEFFDYEAINNLPLPVTRLASATVFACSSTLPSGVTVPNGTTIAAQASKSLTLVSAKNQRAQGPLIWAKSLIRGGFDIIGVHAQGGAVSGPWTGEPVGFAQNMLSIAQKVLPYYNGRADYVFLTAGSNEFLGVSGSANVDQTYNNMVSIGQICLSFGITPVFFTPTAVNSGAGGWTASVPLYLAQLRRRLIELGRTDSRYKIIDWNANVVDPASTTAGYKTTGANWNTDTLHMSEHGGYSLAKLLKSAMNLIFPDVDIAPDSTADFLPSAWSATTAVTVGTVRRPALGNDYVYEVTAIAGTGTTGGAEPTWSTVFQATTIDNAGANQVTWTTRAAPRNKITQPLMTGTTAASPGANFTGTFPPTGTIPNLWKCFSSLVLANTPPVVSVVAKPDGYGNVLRVTITAGLDATVGQQIQVNQLFGFHTQLTPGQWYKAGVEITVSGLTAAFQALNLYAYTSAAGLIASSVSLESSNSTPYPVQGGATDTLYIETPAFLAQASATSSEFRITANWQGIPAGVFDIGRAYIYPSDAP